MKIFARVVLMIVLMVSTAATSHAAGRADDGSPNMITMNFQDVDISVLAKFISEITGKNFVLDESVRGKVSIIS
ncbi:MAG: type II secretion system protein GspD, partial [Candidatus Binataceae bacterium]